MIKAQIYYITIIILNYLKLSFNDPTYFYYTSGYFDAL